MMRLSIETISVLPVVMSSLVLIQIQFASSELLRRGVDFWEPHSLTRRTSEVAMMRLYHSVLWVLILSFVLLQIQYWRPH